MDLEYRTVLLDVDGQVYEVPLLETPRTHKPAKELEKTRKNPPKGEPNVTKTPKSYASHPNKSLDKEIVSIFYRAQKPKANKVVYTNAVRKWERAKKKFSQEFKSLVKELEAGNITRNQFIARARKLFKANYELAYKLGQDAAGLQFLPLSKADLRFLERARSYEYKFLEKFARDIEAKAGKMDYMDRAQMYVDATDAMFHAGRVDAYPVGGTKIYWELGPAEHCIAEGSYVVTDVGLELIEEVTGWMVLSGNGMQSFSTVAFKGVQPTKRVVTELGYELIGTEDHRVKVYDVDAQEIVWRTIGEICPGDWLVLKRGGFPQWSSSLSVELATVLGLIEGDGHITDDEFGLTLNKKLAEHVEPMLVRVFGDALRKNRHSASDQVWVYRCSRKTEVDRIRAFGLKSSRIPKEIRLGGGDVLRAYLRGLFSTDGNVNKGQITLTSVRGDFIRDVQQALLALGVVSRLECEEGSTNFAEHRVLYTLWILGGPNRDKFMDLIGFLDNRGIGPSRISYTKHDVVPKLRYRKLDVSVPTLLGENLAGIPSRAIEWAKAGLLFAQVKSVEDAGERPVYDVVGSSDETFLANGFWVHNCPDCYELADRSPYTPEDLPTTPRAGDTRCLSRCKCSLRIRYEEPEYHDLRARAKRRTGIQTAGLDCVNWRIIDDVVSCFVEWKLLESSPLEVRVPTRRMLMENLQEHVRKLPAWFDPFSEDIYVLHRFGAEVIGGM